MLSSLYKVNLIITILLNMNFIINNNYYDNIVIVI